MTYPLEKISGEIAYLAYHLHWSLEELLAMEHRERHMWIREVSEINRRINESARKR